MNEAEPNAPEVRCKFKLIHLPDGRLRIAGYDDLGDVFSLSLDSLWASELYTELGQALNGS